MSSLPRSTRTTSAAKAAGLALAGAIAALVVTTTGAQAHDRDRYYRHGPPPRVYYAPPPRVYYVPPPPVYYVPPPPVYYAPRPVYREPSISIVLPLNFR